MFYRDERLALFIDGDALQRTSTDLDFRIDYDKIRAEFGRRGILVAAYYFVAVPDSDEHRGVQKLIDWLTYHSYRVVERRVRPRTDSVGRNSHSTDIRVPLAVTALQQAYALRPIQHAVIFSPDEELVPLVEELQRTGVRVSVVGTLNTDTRRIADRLRRAADNFIELDQLRDVIGKND